VKVKAILGIAAAVVVSLVGVTPTASAESAVLAHYEALGVDVDHLAPGWQIVDDQIVWQRETEFGVLTTGVGSVCTPGLVCMYSYPNVTGALWFTNDRGRMHNLGDYGWNDIPSSWRNNSTYDAIWYYHASGSPNPSVCMNSKTYDPTLTGGQDNQATLVYIYNNASTC
jgi:hypothetical protein